MVVPSRIRVWASMVLAVCAVAALAYGDARRESAAALDELAAAQVALAEGLAGSLGGALDAEGAVPARTLAGFARAEQAGHLAILVAPAVGSKPNLVRAEPNLVRAEANLVRAEANLVRAEANLVRAEPNLVRAEPNLVRAEPNLVRAEPNLVRAQSAENRPPAGNLVRADGSPLRHPPLERTIATGAPSVRLSRDEGHAPAVVVH